MSRDRLSGPHLKASDATLQWAQMAPTEVLPVAGFDTEAQKAPSSWAFGERMKGLEPSTFCMASGQERSPLVAALADSA